MPSVGKHRAAGREWSGCYGLIRYSALNVKTRPGTPQPYVVMNNVAQHRVNGYADTTKLCGGSKGWGRLPCSATLSALQLITPRQRLFLRPRPFSRGRCPAAPDRLPIASPKRAT
jgi:hypothetical protein